MIEVIEAPIERDSKGRFQIGHKSAGPGRPLGSRSRLSESFLEDLRNAWLEHGALALARCATEEPSQFCKIVASLMPRDVNLSVDLSAAEFAVKFRTAVELLGNEPPPMKVVNGSHR